MTFDIFKIMKNFPTKLKSYCGNINDLLICTKGQAVL